MKADYHGRGTIAKTFLTDHPDQKFWTRPSPGRMQRAYGRNRGKSGLQNAVVLAASFDSWFSAAANISNGLQGRTSGGLHERKARKLFENNNMKNKIELMAVSLLTTLLLAGCVSTGYVAQPSNITVNALHDVGTGLAALKAAELEMVATNQYLHKMWGTNDFLPPAFSPRKWTSHSM